MDVKTLSYFYQDNGRNRVFLKHYFIRVIRNGVIDPNTQNFLSDGFEWFTPDGIKTKVPCDDSNWCEYMTFKEGFTRGIIEFPFTLKLHNDTFWKVDSIENFDEFIEAVIDFRVKTIKRGWAIKYGASYDDEDFPLLEDLSESELLNWKDPRSNARYKLDDITEHDLIYGRNEHH